MVPFVKKCFQSSRRLLSVKLIVPIVGVLCLGIGFMLILPSHASPAARASGGGCTGGDLKPCISAKNGLVVTKVTVTKSTSQPAEVPTCPFSVNIKIFDNSGQIADTPVGKGCGTFKGPTTRIKAGDTFTSQVVACFSANPADCAAVPSPGLKVS